MQRAAVYHFTDGSDKRPKIYKDQIEALKGYADSLGLDVTEVFCDKSLKRFERTEFDRFLSCSDQFDALIVVDYHHINKNTMECFRIMQQLRDQGVTIYSLRNGVFTFEDDPFDKPLRVATYHSRFGSPSELNAIVPVQNDIFKLFATKKTQWVITDQYFDETEHQNNGEQKKLEELISQKDKYDLIMVHNLNDIHWRTTNFCRFREALQKDIYSLQDGFLKYRKE